MPSNVTITVFHNVTEMPTATEMPTETENATEVSYVCSDDLWHFSSCAGLNVLQLSICLSSTILFF